MIYSLAPMDGITDTAYRQIVKKVFEKYNNDKNKKLLLFTEFVSSDWFVHNFDWIKSHLLFEPMEKPLIVQIFWSNKEKLVSIVEYINENCDFDWIDLNIGCPAPKIMRLWAGSALMKEKDKTLEFVKKLSLKSKKPFSIKTRAWLNSKDKLEQKDFIIKASKYCDKISIHARTMCQGHCWSVDEDFVLDIKKSVWEECKIIFNGWITQEKLQNKEFLTKMQSLDGLMIWQAWISNPWIFLDYKPSFEEKKQIIKEHLNLNIKYKWENRWIVEFRKFIWNYIKWFKNASYYREKLMKTVDLDEFIRLIDDIC